MGQCRTLDADVTFGCYYGDYRSCYNTIPTSLLIWNKFYPSHLYKQVTAAKCTVKRVGSPLLC